MIQCMQLCLDSESTLEDVAEALGPVLGVHFAAQKRRLGEVLRAQIDDIELLLIQNQFENDDVINYEDFRYYLRIEASTDEAMKKYGRDAFEALKGTNQFKLMLVEDLTDKIAEYSPPTGADRTKP